MVNRNQVVVRSSTIAFLILFSISFVVLLLMQGRRTWDGFIYLLQVIAYLIVSRVVANQVYNLQKMNIDYLKGIKGSSVTAALLLSFLMWIFRISRDVILSIKGFQIDFQPFLFICWVVGDVLLSILIGSLVGRSLEKQYGFHDPYQIDY